MPGVKLRFGKGEERYFAQVSLCLCHLSSFSILIGGGGR